MPSPNCWWRSILPRSPRCATAGCWPPSFTSHAAALRDLETWLQLTSGGEDERDERTQVWGHVKDLRRRLAALN